MSPSPDGVGGSGLLHESTIGHRRRRADLLRIAAILSVAIYLVPEGAHFFEMFNKLKMSSLGYMTIQRAYDGWAFFGLAIGTAVGCTLGHAIAALSIPAARWLSLGSCISLACGRRLRGRNSRADRCAYKCRRSAADRCIRPGLPKVPWRDRSPRARHLLIWLCWSAPHQGSLSWN